MFDANIIHFGEFINKKENIVIFVDSKSFDIFVVS